VPRPDGRFATTAIAGVATSGTIATATDRASAGSGAGDCITTEADARSSAIAGCGATGSKQTKPRMRVSMDTRETAKAGLEGPFASVADVAASRSLSHPCPAATSCALLAAQGRAGLQRGAVRVAQGKRE
jgi:hypothetical protein